MRCVLMRRCTTQDENFVKPRQRMIFTPPPTPPHPPHHPATCSVLSCPVLSCLCTFFPPFRGLDDIKESVAEAAVDYAKTVANISVRLCDPHSFVPPASSGSAEGDAAAAAAAAARNDAAGDGPDAAREEAGEARRTIGSMLDDLRASEAEARARGEEGAGGGGGGLGSAERRSAAADEVLRQALERERQGAGGSGAGTAGGAAGADSGGAGRVLGGGGGGRGRRNGPTVDEILRPGRAGAQRSGPPPSEAAREAAAGAVGVTLPWLLRKGILSRCKTSQALAMRTLQRLVKVCDKGALMPHLAELVATLIEGLSALEPQVKHERTKEGRQACVGYGCESNLQKEDPTPLPPAKGRTWVVFCLWTFCFLSIAPKTNSYRVDRQTEIFKTA